MRKKNSILFSAILTALMASGAHAQSNDANQAHGNVEDAHKLPTVSTTKSPSISHTSSATKTHTNNVEKSTLNSNVLSKANKDSSYDTNVVFGKDNLSLNTTELTINGKTYSAPLFIKKMVDSGQIKITKAKPISDSIVALITKNKKGDVEIVYTGEGLLFVGTAITGSGKNIGNDITENDIVPTQIRKIKDKNVVKDGTSKKEIYAFVDPNCHYCKLFHNKIKPYIDKGDVTVNWIPVAILGKSSFNMASNVMKDGAKALDDIYSGNKNQYITKELGPKQTKIVIENNTIMRNLGLSGTPAIIYKENGKIKFMKGMPRTTKDLEKLFKE